MALPAQLIEAEPELGNRSAIQITRRQEFIAGAQESEKGHELCRMAARRADRGTAVF